MAGPKQPIALVEAKGKKHLTKEEIARRKAAEVQPCPDGIAPPDFLTTDRLKERFNTLAGQLQKIKIMGETDCETLGRYVVAQDFYEQAVRDLRYVQSCRPKRDDGPGALITWAALLEKLDKRVSLYFKQAQTTAAALGLTISSRCKLEVPVKEETPKTNKFAKFGKAAGN